MIALKKLTPLLLILIPAVSAIGQNEAGNYTRAQVLKYPLISTALSVVTVTSIGAIDSTEIADVEIPGWFSAIIATQHLPMYKVDKDLGIRYSIAEGGFLTAHYATKTRPTMTLLPFNLYLKTAWYSTYDMYKISRSKAKPGIYTDDWRGYGVKELALASFKWENLSHPLFYIPVGLSLFGAINTIRDSDCSIFKTKKAYVDGEEMSLGAAVPMDH